MRSQFRLDCLPCARRLKSETALPFRDPAGLSVTDFKEIGRRLKAYRIGRGLAAEDIAEKLGISRAALYRIENGDVGPRLRCILVETLSLLAPALQLFQPVLGAQEAIPTLACRVQQLQPPRCLPYRPYLP